MLMLAYLNDFRLHDRLARQTQPRILRYQCQAATTMRKTSPQIQVPHSQHFIFFITYQLAQEIIVLHYTMLQRLARDKQTSFLGPIIRKKENEVL
jgi:hypothetical protein